MGLDLTTKTEKLLTWLGVWGAMRGFCPLASAIVVSVALLESFTPPVIRFFSAVPVNLIHVFAVGIGLLLGLIGYFAGDSWDLLFEMFYGPQGKWLDATGRPFLVFSPGQTLKRHRNQAAQALPRKPDAEDVQEEGPAIGGFLDELGGWFAGAMPRASFNPDKDRVRASLTGLEPGRELEAVGGYNPIVASAGSV